LVERKFPRGTTNQKRYQDLGSARHQYGISALVTQTSFCEGLSGDLAKCWLFSQANDEVIIDQFKSFGIKFPKNDLTIHFPTGILKKFG